MPKIVFGKVRGATWDNFSYQSGIDVVYGSINRENFEIAGTVPASDKAWIVERYKEWLSGLLKLKD